MATLDQIRANFPEAADLSDSEIINRISGAGGLDPKYVAGRFGVQINDPGFVPTIKRSGAQIVGGVGEVVGDVTGNRHNALTNWADDVAFRNPSGINSLQDVAENPWLAVKESVGNAATFLVPGGALKLGATGLRGLRAVNAARAIDNPLTQAAVAGLPSLGEIGEMQRSSGEAENLAAKYGGALGVGAIENLGGVQRMLGFGRAPTQRTIAQQVADLGATPWRTVGKTALRSGLEEGAEEIPQTFIEKAAGYQDPTTAQNLEEAALGGVMGAIGGGVLGTGYGGVRGLKHAQINRYRQQDLLNPNTPLSTLDNQAQWNREFMARDIGREGADSWYQSHMEGVVQDRDLMVQQRYAQARDASMNDLAAQQMGFQDFADFQRWESEQLARRGRPNINTRMGMSEGAPIPPSVIPYSESIQFNPVQPASNVVNGPLTNRDAIVTDAFGVPLNDGSTGSPIEFNPAQVTNPTINGPFSNRDAIVTDAFGVPLNDGATGSPIQFNPAQVTNPTVSGPISGAKAVTRDAFGVPLNDGSTGETISFNPAQVTNPTVTGPISGGKPVARDAFGVPLNDGTTGSPIQFNPVAVEDQRITGPLGGNRASAKVAQNGNSPASGVTNGSGAVVPTGGVVGDGVGERSGAPARGLRQDSTVGDGSGNTDLAVAGFSKKQLSVWRTAVNELGQNHPALEGINQLVSENKLGKAQAAITAAKSGAATEIKLGSVQRKVLDHVSAAFTSGDIDSVYDGKTFKVAEIGRALNMKPGSVKMALNGIKDRLVPLMKKSRARTVEAADQEKLGLSPKVQRTDVVNEADLFGSEEGGVEQSMGVISSIGGSQSAVGDNVAPPDDKGVQTAEEVARDEAIAERARLSAEAEIENILSTADALPAAGDFNSMFGEGTWDKLTRPEQAEFVVAYQNALFEYETYDEVEQALLKEFEEYGQLAETNGSQGLQDPERVSGVKGRSVVLPDGGQAEIANGENGTPQAGESVTDEAARRSDSEAESGVTSSTPSDEAGFGDGKKFSKADATAVDRLNAAVEQWSKIVSDYLARKLDRTKTYVFLDSTPASMQALGLPDLEIRTGMHMLDKANVRLTAEQLKDLPRQLANPKIVYIHDGEKGLSINFVTEYGNGAGNVVIALKPNQYVREAAKTHFVATIVNVPAHNIVREIRNGNGLFVQSKDALEGLRGAIDTAQKQNGRQASEVRAQLARTYNLSSVTKRLLFPSDLVKMIADGRAKYSTGASGSTTVDAINKQLRSLFFSGTRFTNRVVVVENAEALPESLRSDVDGATQAFVQGGKVYMIAGNIAKGNELAVFLHEVGVHLGMANLIGVDNMNRLAMQIKRWAMKNDGSTESTIARAALSRVKSAQRNGVDMNAADVVEERIAYFVEEAVKAGINPTALNEVKGPIRKWFDAFMSAVKTALRKMGVDRFEQLSTQDVVNLAYGAAALELNDAGIDEEARRDGIHVSDELKRKFSKNYTASLIEALPESAQAPVSVVSENVKDAVKRLFNYSIFTNDLGELAEKHIPSVKQWLDAIRERDVTRIKHEEKIDDIASLVDRLKDREQFNRTWKLIKDMTLSQKWGFKPAWRTDVQVDQEMAARYDALTAEERNIIDQVFKHGDQTQREIQSILDETLKHEFDLAQGRAKTPKDRADLDAEFKKFKSMYGRKLAMPDGPYAPLRRVGTHVVIAKSQRFKDAEALGADLTELKQDENHYFVNFYDSLGEAKVQAQALVRKFGEGNVIASEKDASWQDNNLFPFQAFDKLRTMVSEREDRAAGSMLKLLNELYLVSLAETSARKSELSRTNAAGIDEQGMYRAFVSKGKADAHYIGTLKNGKAVTDAEYAMRNEVKDSSDREAAMRYFNELMKRYENTSKYSPAPLVQKLMQFNSLWHLLTKPAYFVYNATQPLMMTLPTLAGRFGYGRSSDAMMRAYRESIAVPNLFSRERINFAAMPADVRGAMNELLNRGKLDITILMDLGDRVHAGRSKISRGMATVDGALKNVASKTEMLNRLVTGMSAYRLAIGDGRTHADAVNYAAKVIDETQGDYTNFNAPRLMNASSTAKLVTQFRKFQLVQLSFMVKLVKQSKADPVARKALAFVLAHHAIMAGSLGLPAANLVALAFAAMGGDDEPRDLELSMRKEIGDEFMADLLTRGVPAALLNINMSGNVGMGQMFSLLPFTDVDLSSRDGAAKTAFGLLGPVSGNVANMADGVGYFQNGDYYRGLEAMLPSGIKGAMKGLREAGEGVTNKRGDTLLTPEEIDLWSTMAKVAGFRTTDDTLRQLVTGKRYEFEQYFNDHTSKIKNAYVKAYRSGDSDTMAELRERWTAMQDNKRNLGFSTQGLSNLLKAPQEAVKRERATVNGVQTTKSNRGFVEAATE